MSGKEKMRVLRSLVSLLVAALLVSCGRRGSHADGGDIAGPPNAFASNPEYVQVWCRETGDGPLSLKIFSDIDTPDRLTAVGWRTVDGMIEGGVVWETSILVDQRADEVTYTSGDGDFRLNVDLTQAISSFKYSGILDVDQGAETYDLECRVDLP